MSFTPDEETLAKFRGLQRKALERVEALLEDKDDGWNKLAKEEKVLKLFLGPLFSFVNKPGANSVDSVSSEDEDDKEIERIISEA